MFLTFPIKSRYKCQVIDREQMDLGVRTSVCVLLYELICKYGIYPCTYGYTHTDLDLWGILRSDASFPDWM